MANAPNETQEPSASRRAVKVDIRVPACRGRCSRRLAGVLTSGRHLRHRASTDSNLTTRPPWICSCPAPEPNAPATTPASRPTPRGPAFQSLAMADTDFSEGVLDCTVDKPQKENDGTKDAYISYLVTTRVPSPRTFFIAASSCFELCEWLGTEGMLTPSAFNRAISSPFSGPNSACGDALQTSSFSGRR